jgi:hypothetical protein
MLSKLICSLAPIHFTGTDLWHNSLLVWASLQKNIGFFLLDDGCYETK